VPNRRWLPILATAALIAGGCSGSNATFPATATQPPSVSTTAAPPPTAAPTPTPMPDIASLAAEYTKLVSQASAALTQAQQDLAAAGSDLTMLEGATQEALTATNQFVAGMRAFDWGPVQAQADDLVRVLAKLQEGLVAAMNAPDAGSFVASSSSTASLQADLDRAEAALEVALGLPPVSVPS
jgi:hypothetical protein